MIEIGIPEYSNDLYQPAGIGSRVGVLTLPDVVVRVHDWEGNGLSVIQTARMFLTKVGAVYAGTGQYSETFFNIPSTEIWRLICFSIRNKNPGASVPVGCRFWIQPPLGDSVVISSVVSIASATVEQYHAICPCLVIPGPAAIGMNFQTQQINDGMDVSGIVIPAPKGTCFHF